MSEDLVYSTGKKVEKKKEKKGKISAYKPAKGPLKMRIEKKKRGGKTVTVLYDLPHSFDEAKALMKKLQGHLACGATFKNNVIELSGDNRDKIEKFFKDQGNS